MLLAAAMVVRAWLVGVLPLHPYEAYQWLCSRHLACGYYDGPPLLSWVFRGLSDSLGDDLRSLRMIPLVSGLATAGLIAALGQSLFRDLRVGVLATLFYFITPIHALRGLVVFDEGALQPVLWLAVLWAYRRAVVGRRWSWWLGAGVIWGIGLLNRWAMGLMPVCLLLLLDLSPRHPHLLRSPRLWASLGVGALVALPVLALGAGQEVLFIGIWERLFGESAHLGASDLAYLAAQQFVALGPGMLVLHAFAIAYAFWAVGTRRDDRYLWCLAFSLPVLAFFAALSAFLHVSAQSLEFGYLTAHVCAAAAVLECARGMTDRSFRKRAGAVLIGLLATNAALAALAQSPALLSASPIQPAYFVGFWIECSGWQDLARHIGRQVDQSGGALGVASPDYRVCSALSYLTSSKVQPLCLYDTARGAQFTTWQDASSLHGRDVLLITPDESLPKRYYRWVRASFVKVEPLPSVSAPTGLGLARVFGVDRGSRFQGNTSRRW